jgi:ABC-type polysaccharide/polyol phosphate export permease
MTLPGSPAGPSRGALGSALTEVWDSRYLLKQLVLRDVRIRYKQALFGFAWAILMPSLIVLSGAMVRVAMSQFAGTGFDRQTVAALLVKGLPWGFFVGAIGFATASMTGNTNLVSKVYFPREVLPLSAILAQAFDTGISTITCLMVLPFLGVVWGPALLWVPLLLLVLFCFTVAIGLLLSCANVFFRDVKYIVQVLLTFGIFFTPVFFEPAMLGARGARLVMINPLAPILEGLRLAVLRGHDLLLPLSVETATGPVVGWSPWYLAYAGACAFGGLLLSVFVFRAAQDSFAEYV